MPNATSVTDKNILADYQSALDEMLQSYQHLPPCGCDRMTPANPFFLSADENFKHSRKKVMFFGQETMGWHNEHAFPGCRNATDLIECYKKWHLDGVPTHRASLIKHATKRIKKVLKSHDFTGFIWNNIVKIGRHKAPGLPCKHILEWQEKICNPLIRKETSEYFLPDAIVFFTGDRDDCIKNVFRDVSFESAYGENPKNLAIVKSKDFSNIPAIRTKHPNALNRLGKDKRDQILDQIAAHIIDRQ